MNQIETIQNLLAESDIICQKLSDSKIGLGFSDGDGITINIQYKENLDRIEYISTVTGLSFAPTAVPELVKILTNINNVITYGHFIIVKTVVEINVLYICHSSPQFLDVEEILYNLRAATYMINTYAPEFKYLGTLPQQAPQQ